MEKYRYNEAEASIMEKSAVPFAVYQFLDERVVTVLLSAGFYELFGFGSRKEAFYAMDNDMYKDVHRDDAARVADAAIRFAKEGEEYNEVYRLMRNGEYRVIHAFGRHIYPEEGVRLGMIWYVDEGVYSGGAAIDQNALVHDFSISLRESGLLRKTSYDFLTGLPNMTHFYDLARASRDLVIASGGECALGYANLNGLKYYNKKYGFAEGDKVLIAFAELMVKYFSLENTCRIGQDNYAFFSERDHLEGKLQALFAEFDSMFGERKISVRVGLYPSSMGIVDASLAVDRARFASNFLRDTHSSAYLFFNESMLEYENNRLYVIENLDKALAENWICAYYQPIVRAANGSVCDEEALARWIDPEKGMLSPADFIPILEDANLIYKVDLHMVDLILERMEEQKREGLYVVPISVNLSRTDFDACDIVDEITKRVDAAGIDRDRLTIEITESVVGSDFEFMKTQVERFQSLGFKVWMDDFGSGYSSLDLLQTMHFDLVKLDMRFMKQFDKSERSRVIVTELVKMALGLGVDTVCEGVETLEQAEFLREVGCTKLQGFYYCKPVPFEEVVNRNRQGIQIGFENPEEADYFASLGCINLYDIATVAHDDSDTMDHYFNTMPMAILEINDEAIRIVRCNRTYREFLERIYGFVDIGTWAPFDLFEGGNAEGYTSSVRRCAKEGGRLFTDERFSEDATARLLMRRIAKNPVTGVVACAVMILELVKGK